MSRPYKHVVIDGVDFNVDDFSTDIVTYSHETIQTYIAQGKPNVKITIRLGDMRFTAPIDGMEIKGDTVYVYGPLRNFFPALFKDKVLLPWQRAYLIARADYKALDLYTIWRDDAMFDTVNAKWFFKGYLAALEDEARGMK